jgi:hypothetical protein
MEPFTEALEIVAEVMRRGPRAIRRTIGWNARRSITSAALSSICGSGRTEISYRTIYPMRQPGC